MSKSNEHEYYFLNREDAAIKLIETLPLDFLKENDTVVIGVSAGGVFYADKIARATNSQLDILLSAPVPAPNNPELAIAMISETKEVVLHKALVDAFEISEDFIYSEAQRKYEEEVLSYVYKYRKGKDLVPLEGKYVVLVDECIETGLTMMAALKSVIARGAKTIYIATPILDKSVYDNLLKICDGVFCPYKIEHYISIEYYFKDYKPLTYEEIIDILNYHYEKKKENK